MTPSTISLPVSVDDRRIAAMAGAAVGLAVAEAAIPLPFPGIKPGLANIVTLLVLYRYGWRAAAWVVGLRIVAGALLLIRRGRRLAGNGRPRKIFPIT